MGEEEDWNAMKEEEEKRRRENREGEEGFSYLQRDLDFISLYSLPYTVKYCNVRVCVQYEQCKNRESTS